MARHNGSLGKKSARQLVARKRAITPDDLLRFHFVSDPQVSPDGARILFARKHVGEKNEYVTNLWIVDAGGGEVRQFSSGGKDSHGRWSPDGRTIAFISGRDKHNPNLFILSADGGEATPLTTLPEGKIGGFKWSPDGTKIAFTFRETESDWTEQAKKDREETGGSTPPRVIDEMYYRLDGDGYFNARRFELFVVDVATGGHRRIYRDNAGSFDFDWSPDSSELVVSGNRSPQPLLAPWKDELLRVDAAGGKVRKVAGVPVGPKGAVRWSPNGKQIAFAGRQGKEIWGVHNTRLYVADAGSGATRELTGGEDYCLSAAVISDSAEPIFGAHLEWTPDSRRILMSIGWHGETHVASIDAVGGEIQFHTHGRQSVAFGNVSDDGSTIALTVANEVELGEVAVGRFSHAHAGSRGSKAKRHDSAAAAPLEITKLTAFNTPLLDELDIVPPEEHWVKSASGSPVQVWVVRPSSPRRKKSPAVLEIHGGPHAQYGTTFFHEFQVLAAAGYVVVYSNPRGSKGYGEEHCTAIKGNWGQADWEDVQGVIGFMKQQPYIDARKMGVMGGSYGGYMTNWAIGHCRDFAAAITDRCVANLVSMVGSSDIPLVPGEYWDGNSWDRTENIWDQSPLKYFGNVETPTLIIHSEGDLRCNVEQGEQVFAALKLRSIPTRLVRYPASTSHGMSRSGPPDLRLHRLRQILEWWGKYLG